MRRTTQARWRMLAAGVLLAACLDTEARPIVRVADPPTALALYYDNLEPGVEAPAINFIIKLHNLGHAPLALSELEVRYYFRDTLGDAFQTDVFYTDTCCNEVRRDFNAAVQLRREPSASSQADHYLSIRFDAVAGSVLPDDTAQVEVSYHAPNYERSLEQREHYSFRAEAQGSQAAWDRCPPACGRFTNPHLAVYRRDVLVWGTPP